MKKKVISLMLALVLLLGLAVPALAYETPDFTDVPPGNWAYKSVMRMADKGIVKGTGNRIFSPNGVATAEQFVTLVGRIVFPDVKTTGSDWSGPYIAAAKEKGMLAGTGVTNQSLKSAISRYDMAMILRAAARILGAKETMAEPSAIGDYGMTPTMYADAVRAVYGAGLITGDENHNFNGQNFMRRNELAVVMDRLLKLREEVEAAQRETELVYNVNVFLPTDGVMVLGEGNRVSCGLAPLENIPEELNQAHNRNGFTCISSDPSIVEVLDFDGWNWNVKARKVGTATITITDPRGVSGAKDITVVEAREGLGTETYRLRVAWPHYSEYSFKGESYTKNHYLDDVPYKIYYTRDGGETSQLVYEGVSQRISDNENLKVVTVELPEDAFYSKSAGFYLSAETIENGQRLVTSDLRTDGRAYKHLVKNTTDFKGDRGALMEFLLTPPNGAKAKVTLRGTVGYGGNGGPTVGEGFDVRVYLKDGRLIAEGKTNANGKFVLECEIDALDNGFNTLLEQYYVTASGVQDGVRMERDGKFNGELLLYSLRDFGADPDRPRSGLPVGVYPVEN